MLVVVLALTGITSACSFVPSTRDHALTRAREQVERLTNDLEYFVKSHDSAQRALDQMLSGKSSIGDVVIDFDGPTLRALRARNGVWIYRAEAVGQSILDFRILLRGSAQTADWTGTENHNVYLCAAITQSFTEPKTTSVEQVECPHGLVDGTSNGQKEDEATLDEIGLDGNE